MDLTLEQKASLTSGRDFWHTQDVDKHGIPTLLVTDGPHGVRKQLDDADAIGLGQSVPATCFPPAAGLASSWDPDLAHRVGCALGDEAREFQVSVLLGPGVNIKRSPLCGRNFEYFSEDPYLSGRLGAAWVRGVQSRGIGTSLKHFAANNQESDRLRVSAEVDERTLREIYFPAFEHIVTTEQPATVMCAYNKINGTHASEHHELLTEILRDEWGFEGLVVSDWGAVSDRLKALAAGTDLEMPPTNTDDQIVAAVRTGELDESVLDLANQRLLSLIERTTAGREVEPPTFDRTEHHVLAREAAIAAAVLLKNDGDLLPLDTDTTIAVIGEFARTPRYQGAGSSQVVPTQLDTALEAIIEIAGADRVRFAPGFELDETPTSDELLTDAVKTASASDVAVLFLGLPGPAESEGFDRTDIDLPPEQLALLDAVYAANPNTVVVLSNGAVVDTVTWDAKARALLEGWLLGQGGGHATAQLLFGVESPSGKLAETIPLRLQDNPSYLFFPGGEQHVRYGEGIYVGYRYYDTLDRPVAYPFGFGLTYTTFELGEPIVRKTGPNAVEISLSVTNTGRRRGSEVVQLYVHDEQASVERPVHELKGFAKVTLEPGTAETVTISLDERSFSYWSQLQHRWVTEAGGVELRVGVSSRDIRQRVRLEIDGDGVLTPLDATSTLGEWLAHPGGAELLKESGAGATYDDMSWELRKIVEAMPIAKLAALGLGMSGDQLTQLLAAADRD
jgi:beta-glucosidase